VKATSSNCSHKKEWYNKFKSCRHSCEVLKCVHTHTKLNTYFRASLRNSCHALATHVIGCSRLLETTKQIVRWIVCRYDTNSSKHCLFNITNNEGVATFLWLHEMNTTYMYMYASMQLTSCLISSIIGLKTAFIEYEVMYFRLHSATKCIAEYCDRCYGWRLPSVK
jgi:hypothetical protein